MAGESQETSLRFRILYYPFMGTDINTERLITLARVCYSPLGVDELADMVMGRTWTDEQVGEFIRNLLQSGHHGALEHWTTSFAVEGYSRISSQQNDRHRLITIFKDAGVVINEPEQASAAVSQLQQSQRYVKEKHFRYVVPPTVAAHPELLAKYRRIQEDVQAFQNEGLKMKVPAEDLRFALTNATETRFVISTNARQLRHMFNLRCCTRAQWEIRRLFSGLLAEYKRIAPNIFHGAGASCDEFGYCPEGSRSCGRMPTLAQLKGQQD
ncbi:MAG: FAD-dependent thymidylate synthase [Chloroflexota bacterium]